MEIFNNSIINEVFNNNLDKVNSKLSICKLLDEEYERDDEKSNPFYTESFRKIENPNTDNRNEKKNKQIILKSKPIINIPINIIRSEQNDGDDNSTKNYTDFMYEEEKTNDKKNEKENATYTIIFPQEEKDKPENYEMQGDNNLSSHIKKELSTKESNIQINDRSNNKNIKKKTHKINSYNIEILKLYLEIKNIDIHIYYRVKYKNNIYTEKPKYNIPIDKIDKEIKDKNNIINKNNEIKNDNTQNNIHSNNSVYKISNCIYSNQNNNYNNYNNYNYYDKNKFLYLNNNIYSNNNNNNQYLTKILEQKKRFEKLKELGLYALTNVQNINNYLLKLYINFINNNYNTPFISYNSNIDNNYNKFYYNYGNQNHWLYNYRPNNNILNMNDLSQLKNINNEKYTITLKSKTDDPNIEKISKIQVTTSNIKDNQNIKQENEAKKDKNIKNIINLEDIKLGKETRTVVRLNPIPPNYSSFDVSKLLDKYLKIESGKNQRIYKALYTPLCKIIGKNLGYCFVMMSKPKYVIDFYNTFNGKIFGKKKCKKPCNVIWADKQGDEFLKTTEEDPIRKPIIFKDLKND